MKDILKNVKLFAGRRRKQQGYDNTSTFSSKTAKLKNVGHIKVLILCTSSDDALYLYKIS